MAGHASSCTIPSIAHVTHSNRKRARVWNEQPYAFQQASEEAAAEMSIVDRLPHCPTRSACCWNRVLRNCDGYQVTEDDVRQPGGLASRAAGRRSKSR